MKTNVIVGSASAAPGQKATGFLKVAELNDGSPVNVPIIIVNGSREGHSLWIQCCIHGNEVASTYALLRAVNEIDPKKMSGTLIGVPVLNITAFWKDERIPIFDTVDLNRIMPGKANGSFAQQYANVVYATFMSNKPDYLIDTHWAGKVDWALYNEELDKRGESKQLAEISAFEVVVSNARGGVLNGAQEGGGMMISVAAREGTPSIILESRNIEKLHLAFMNILKYLRMIEGEPIAPKYQRSYNGFIWQELVIKHGGLFHQKVQDGDEVSRGQLLGTVTNIFGEDVEKVTCPINGVILLSPGHIPVKTGDSPFEIANRD
jgi:predicted deacylase